MKPTFNNQSGFSILELLIALALMALIAAGLASTMGLGVQVWERSQVLQNAEPKAALRIVLRSWITQITPPKRTLPFEHPFTGTINAFSFTTLANLPSSPGTTAIYVSVNTDENGLNMRVSYLDDIGAVKSHEERSLSSAEMVFSYYDRGTGEWVSEWSDNRHIPDLIRIETKIASREWPEFTVAPIF